MSKDKLKNPPLVEAIFELRWALQPLPGTVNDTTKNMLPEQSAVMTDPHYKILIGKMSDRIGKEYPYHEQLPTASIPDEIAGYVVQHRFRTGEGKWPLIQLGPGIITLNDNESYTKWSDFKERIDGMIKALFATYPEPQKLKIKGVVLRYIDSIDFDYKKDAILGFLRDYMKIDIELPPELFEPTNSDASPSNYSFMFSFPLKEPAGAVITLRFGRGRKKDKDALLWETVVEAWEMDSPKTPSKLLTWTESAHGVAHNCFFKIISGKLEARFE